MLLANPRFYSAPGSGRWGVMMSVAPGFERARQKHRRVLSMQVAADAIVRRCRYLYSARRSGSNIAGKALMPW